MPTSDARLAAPRADREARVYHHPMTHHWKYEAELPANQEHSIQVQTDSRSADFNLLILDTQGQVLAADRGPEAGARCVIETSQRQRVVFIVELLTGSGSFSLQVASQPAAAPRVAATPTSTPQSRAQLTTQQATGQGLSSDEQQQMLTAHNRWRHRFGVTPLQWSAELAAHAQQWADELAATGMRMRHRSPNDFGENLYWCSGRASSSDDVVDAWGSEEALYDYDANNWWPQAGHFSQLVWHTTTHVGGAVVRRDGQELWVCNYNPRGNWTGKRPYEK